MDYYQVLEVPKEATADDIRRAYKKKALDSHPDRPNGNESKFRQVNEAYEILSNMEKRKVYDQYGKEGLDREDPETDLKSFFTRMDPFRVFREMFPDVYIPPHGPAGPFGGPPVGVGKVQRAQDIYFPLHLKFEEVYHGCNKSLAVRRRRFCKLCCGFGIQNVDPSGGGVDFPNEIKCIQCNGSGKQTIKSYLASSEMMENLCSFCQGEGMHIPISAVKCPTCQGSRLVEERAIFSVNIEPGTPEGFRIICNGEGDDSLIRADKRGDVILKITAEMPPGWTRIGQHLIHRLPISLSACLQGVSQPVIHPIGHTFLFSLPHVVKPNIVLGRELFSPWFVLDWGFPDFQEDEMGSTIILLDIQFPTTLATTKEEQVHFWQWQYQCVDDQDKYIGVPRPIIRQAQSSKEKQTLQLLFSKL